MLQATRKNTSKERFLGCDETFSDDEPVVEAVPAHVGGAVNKHEKEHRSKRNELLL